MKRTKNFEAVKAELKNVANEQAAFYIKNRANKKTFLSCGRVDFVSDEVQYEIVGCYIGVGRTKTIDDNNVCLVHKDGSEGAEKGKITRLKDIKSIDAIELILKGLFEKEHKGIKSFINFSKDSKSISYSLNNQFSNSYSSKSSTSHPLLCCK